MSKEFLSVQFWSQLNEFFKKLIPLISYVLRKDRYIWLIVIILLLSYLFLERNLTCNIKKDYVVLPISKIEDSYSDVLTYAKLLNVNLTSGDYIRTQLEKKSLGFDLGKVSVVLNENLLSISTEVFFVKDLFDEVSKKRKIKEYSNQLDAIVNRQLDFLGSNVRLLERYGVIEKINSDYLNLIAILVSLFFVRVLFFSVTGRIFDVSQFKKLDINFLGPLGTVKRGKEPFHFKGSRTMYSEGLRYIELNLRHQTNYYEKKLFSVTSSLAGDGKTSFCYNLALLVSQSKRVLLIDADLRRPHLRRTVNQSYNTDKKNLGLSEYLQYGNVEIKEILYSYEGRDKLDMIFSGNIHTIPVTK
ncbi:hypothetical protein [Lewinella sp. LCG006]|uniref:hypothetical protein n=1 Tax=Lewinella sp. LCG006 TaxID=3231911 RepID=UPI003461101D